MKSSPVVVFTTTDKATALQPNGNVEPMTKWVWAKEQLQNANRYIIHNGPIAQIEWYSCLSLVLI